MSPSDLTRDALLRTLEREWLDSTPPAGHPLIHGIFQRLPDQLAAHSSNEEARPEPAIDRDGPATEAGRALLAEQRGIGSRSMREEPLNTIRRIEREAAHKARAEVRERVEAWPHEDGRYSNDHRKGFHEAINLILAILAVIEGEQP